MGFSCHHENNGWVNVTVYLFAGFSSSKLESTIILLRVEPQGKPCLVGVDTLAKGFFKGTLAWNSRKLSQLADPVNGARSSQGVLGASMLVGEGILYFPLMVLKGINFTAGPIFSRRRKS